MEISAIKDGGAVVMTLKGRMDATTSPKFMEDFKEWTKQKEFIYVIDLTDLEYLSSAGLRSFLAAAKDVKPFKGKLVFCGLQNMVTQVFEMSGFASMFKVVPTLTDAMRSI